MRILPFLKNSTFYFLVIFAGTFLQVYWAMGFLSDNTSSHCLECSFFEDIFLYSILTGILLSLIFSFISKINNRFLKIAAELFFTTATWFFWNYEIFVDRESSWSTYLLTEELFVTLYCSLFPILTMSVVVIFIINYRLILKRNETS
ncbi:hypothetical protein BXY58_1438 [Epilithonimonas arachidiradicis]|uniref:Uncharacterized protein n=1 Tax=Epilithonimonas arachidiradicis TaxID=1617282 RepID=A0A420DAM8_9FLAO|nr:hypothetical protein BXY58_1438 [Epilithonimonas arachidiradicis]